MKIALITVLSFHAGIHLFGFLKAYDFLNLNANISQKTKSFGLLWLMTFALFFISIVLYYSNQEIWWMAGAVAVVLSQILVFNFWQETKFASIPNLLFLIFIIISAAGYAFDKQINQEVQHSFSAIASLPNDNSTENKISTLPVPVQKWLHQSGALDQGRIQNVYLTQDISLKLKPDQEKWYPATAEQFFTTQPPSFIWSVDVNMNPLTTLKGRDRFEAGKGEMLIKLFSLIPIVNVKDNKKIDQGALQRYLAETMWFPTAALSPDINWESIDEFSAQATLSYGATQESGIFKFNEQGDCIGFTAMRYQDGAADAQPKEWRIEVLAHDVKNGIRIPIHSKVTWKLAQGYWNWLDLKIRNIEYNLEAPPILNN